MAPVDGSGSVPACMNLVPSFMRIVLRGENSPKSLKSEKQVKKELLVDS